MGRIVILPKDMTKPKRPKMIKSRTVLDFILRQLTFNNIMWPIWLKNKCLEKKLLGVAKSQLSGKNDWIKPRGWAGKLKNPSSVKWVRLERAKFSNAAR